MDCLLGIIEERRLELIALIMGEGVYLSRIMMKVFLHHIIHLLDQE